MFYPYRDSGESWAAYIRRLETRSAVRSLITLFVGVFLGLAFACFMFSWDRFALIARVHQAEAKVQAQRPVLVVKETKASPTYMNIPPIQLFLDGATACTMPPLLLYFDDDAPICRRHPRWNLAFSFH